MESRSRRRGPAHTPDHRNGRNYAASAISDERLRSVWSFSRRKVCIRGPPFRVRTSGLTMTRGACRAAGGGGARPTRPKDAPSAKRPVRGVSAVLYLVAAVAIASLLPSERQPDGLLVAGLIVGYALVSRVRFEFGDSYVVPEQLVYIPLLALAPLPLVPLIVAVAVRARRAARTCCGAPGTGTGCVTSIGDCWFMLPPVLVVAAFAPGTPTVADAGRLRARLRGAAGRRPGLVAGPRPLHRRRVPQGSRHLLLRHGSRRRRPHSPGLRDRRRPRRSSRSACWRSRRSSGSCRCSPRTASSATPPPWSCTAPTAGR